MDRQGKARFSWHLAMKERLEKEGFLDEKHKISFPFFA